MAHRRPQGQLRSATTSIQFGTGMATEPDVPATPTIMAASWKAFLLWMNTDHQNSPRGYRNR